METEALSMKKSTSSSVSADYVRDATLCMLRRTSEINVPALSQYLSTHFPDIPGSWCNAMVVSTFTAAQKVAATYAEIVLGGEDDDRAALAKKAMSRWLHGLSAVEPGRPHKELTQTVAPPEVYSPSTNFLIDRHVPVPSESAILQRQFESDLSKAEAVDVSISFDEPASAVEAGGVDEAGSVSDHKSEDLVIVATTGQNHDNMDDEEDIMPRLPTDEQSDNVSMPMVDETELDDVEPDDEPETQTKESSMNDVESNESESVKSITGGAEPEFNVGNCTFDALLESLCEETFFPVLSPIRTPVQEAELQLHPTPSKSLEEPTPVPVQVEKRKRLVSLVTVVNEDDAVAQKKHHTETERELPRTPLKQLQERSSHHEHPATQPRGQYRHDDDRSENRRATYRRYSSGHRHSYDRLSEEQRRWLDRMPSAWRRR